MDNYPGRMVAEWFIASWPPPVDESDPRFTWWPENWCYFVDGHGFFDDMIPSRMQARRIGQRLADEHQQVATVQRVGWTHDGLMRLQYVAKIYPLCPVCGQPAYDLSRHRIATVSSSAYGWQQDEHCETRADK